LRALPLTIRALRERERLARWRDARVAALIAHAQRNVPFVRDTLGRLGLEPGDVRGVADLPLLPVTTKRDLQEAALAPVPDRTVAAERRLDRSTSGSTGERLIVKRTWFEERLLNAFRRRAMRAYGLTPVDRLAILAFHRLEDPRDDQTALHLAQRTGLFRQR